MSVGIRYGPCVPGDIGRKNGHGFAVIDDTVNIASRVEAKTLELDSKVLLTEAFVESVGDQVGNPQREPANFNRFEDQEIRGIDEKITLFGR